MPMKGGAVKDLVSKILFPAFKAERERLEKIDKWYRWEHESPHQPRHATREYKELAGRAQTPWLGLVVTSVAQALYVEGYRQEGEGENATPWGWWQANGMDRKQIPIHRAALAYGHSNVTVLPGRDPLTNDRIPVMRGISPRRMITFYNEPEYDDWPRFALRGDPVKIKGTKGWALRVYDDEAVYYLRCNTGGDGVEFISHEVHNIGVCPVVRFTNMLDLEGRTPGEVEPFIPVAARIDQTVFDRLVVQRFSAWVVRTIAGMAKPEADGEQEAEAAEAATRLKLQVSDILIAEDHETKFGSLPATDLAPFIKAAEADIHALAAVSQTPAHELLGQMANLSAEALAAARASLTAKVAERKQSFGESHEQVFRLAAYVMGDVDAARDVGAQVRWADTEIRSLAQAADALGKLAQMLGVPVEVLWERIPGFTAQDVQRAKDILEKGGDLATLTALLDRQMSDDGTGATGG